MTRKIGVITGTRAEYGYLRPLMLSIDNHPDLILRVYVTGMHLLKDQGDSIKEIQNDGFEISAIVDMGAKAMTNTHDLAVSIGKGVLGFSDLFHQDKPDIVVVLGDRNEPFAAATAATTMNIPIAHLAGGDVGFGDIDHVLRHAITKLAHLHFVQTELSKERVLKLGEEEWRVMNVGALALDTILNSKLLSRKELAKKFDMTQNSYILVVHHPTTTEWQEMSAQMRLVLESVDLVARDHDLDIVVIYPNDYPGGLEMIKIISKFVKNREKVHVFKNLAHLDFISMMSLSSVFVGNSSSGIIEAPSLGVPFVSIGTRQKNRERANNTIDVGYSKGEITAAIEKTISDSVFRTQVEKRITPYGNGTASTKIVEALNTIQLGKRLLQKKLTY